MKEMRPTTGKVTLALFNILGNIHGRSFLDLFSGSGQIALTAARRSYLSNRSGSATPRSSKKRPRG